MSTGIQSTAVKHPINKGSFWCVCEERRDTRCLIDTSHSLSHVKVGGNVGSGSESQQHSWNAGK